MRSERATTLGMSFKVLACTHLAWFERAEKDEGAGWSFALFVPAVDRVVRGSVVEFLPLLPAAFLGTGFYCRCWAGRGGSTSVGRGRLGLRGGRRRRFANRGRRRYTPSRRRGRVVLDAYFSRLGLEAQGAKHFLRAGQLASANGLAAASHQIPLIDGSYHGSRLARRVPVCVISASMCRCARSLLRQVRGRGVRIAVFADILGLQD